VVDDVDGGNHPGCARNKVCNAGKIGDKAFRCMHREFAIAVITDCMWRVVIGFPLSLFEAKTQRKIGDFVSVNGIIYTCLKKLVVPLTILRDAYQLQIALEHGHIGKEQCP
jgi:hypothetical protein